MDSVEFRKRGKEMVDFIANYMDTLAGRRVTSEVEPGYLRNRLPEKPPRAGDKFEDIMNDVERAIMPGVKSLLYIHVRLLNLSRFCCMQISSYFVTWTVSKCKEKVITLLIV